MLFLLYIEQDTENWKRDTSLITGPQHSLVEEQKVQILLLKSEANRLFKTALKVVDPSLTHILGGEGKLCCTLWHLWCLVMITADQ